MCGGHNHGFVCSQ